MISMDSLLILFFLFHLVKVTLFETFLWQLKEYRFDRMWAHLSTTQGKRILFNGLIFSKWLLLIVSLFAYSVKNDVLFTALIIILYLAEILQIILGRFKGFRFPKRTSKALLTVGLTFSFNILTLFFVPLKKALLVQILDRFLPLVIIGSFLLANLPAFLVKKILIFLAKRKIQARKKLLVIGITGSYGKTSTKDFLTEILSRKFRVIKTAASQNTEFAIALTILRRLSPSDEIFIVEMGAYKKGEIKEICDMVRPEMGIITGINEQHIELFGSLDNTKKAKYELIESLPDHSTAIFNGNNKHSLEMASWAEKQKLNVLTYQTKKDIKNIKAFKDHLEFIVLLNDNEYNCQVSLLGVQNIENILAAIYAVRSLKMSMADIRKGLKKITSPSRTMRLIKTLTGMNLIDDTFNANPDGVISAIEYMKLYEGKKILVLSPLIELGRKSSQIHERIGESASKICNLIVLTNPNFEKSFYDGVLKTDGNIQKVKVVNKTQAFDLLKENIDKKGVVVFEGKESGGVLRSLLKELNIHPQNV